MFRILFDLPRSSILNKDLLLHENPYKTKKECIYENKLRGFRGLGLGGWGGVVGIKFYKLLCTEKKIHILDVCFEALKQYLHFQIFHHL